MATRRRLIAVVSALGLVALAGFAYVANRSVGGVSTPAADAGGKDKGAPVSVETAEVERIAMPDELGAVGTLRSNESVVLRPEIAGRVSAIHFKDGAAVSKGALLVVLDAATQRAELAQARASEALARTNAQRTEDLFRRNFVSQRARDEAAAALAVAQAGSELLAARLRQTEIRAPFSGVVGIRSVSVGDYVKEGADLINLEDIATLKLDFRLPDIYLARLKPGQLLVVASDAFPDKSFSARVDAIDPLVDAEGRALRLRAHLDNAEGLLRPGMFVRVSLVMAEREGLAVPEEALMPSGEGPFVFVVRDDKAVRVAVTTGSRRNAQIEIRSGVGAGERVVTAGQIKLHDGSSVIQVDRPATPGAAN